MVYKCEGNHSHKTVTFSLIWFEKIIIEPLPWGGGGSRIFPWSLNRFWFYPLFSFNKPLVPYNGLSSGSLKPKNYCAVPLVPKKVCQSPGFACLSYLLFIVEKIVIESRWVFPWSQQSYREFLCSLKIICQYPLFPTRVNASVYLFPKISSRGSFFF